MPFSWTDILWGGAAPALVAVMIHIVVQRVFPSEFGERYASTLAILAGFMTGVGSLHLVPGAPTAHWHWLPYTMLGASVIGPVSRADGVGTIERILLYGVAATAIAWFLVPAWDDLSPSRFGHAVALIVYVTTLASLLEPLTPRFPGPLLPAILWLTATTAAVILAMSGSLRFAQIALSGAAAVFGILLHACFRREGIQLAGIGLTYSVMVVGSLLIGRVNSFSDIPLLVYMLVPTAPLLLWGCASGPLARLTGVKRSLVHAIIPVAVLACSLVLALISEMSGGADY